MIFDVENWLWKSDFGTFWQLFLAIYQVSWKNQIRFCDQCNHPSIWNVFIKFCWHDEKLTTVPCMRMLFHSIARGVRKFEPRKPHIVGYCYLLSLRDRERLTFCRITKRRLKRQVQASLFKAYLKILDLVLILKSVQVMVRLHISPIFSFFCK